MNAHLWRSCRKVAGQLRCAILLAGGCDIEEWAQQTIALLGSDPAIALETIYRLDIPAHADPPSAAIFKGLNRGSRASGSPLNRVEIQAPKNVPVVALEGEFRAQLAARGLDVLIWLESRALDLDCDGLARLGVWYLYCGDPDEPLSDPPYWSEVANGRATSTLALQQDTGNGNVRQLAVCQLATRYSLSMANATDPLTLAGPFLLRNLLNALDLNAPDSDSSPSLAPVKTRHRLVPRRPGTLETAGAIARIGFRSAWSRWRSHGRDGKWFVALRTNRDVFRTHRDFFEQDGFRDVPAPQDSQFADPFVVEDNGRHWLFVEEIPSDVRKGRLAVMELRSDGSPGEPVTILDRPYHLSYPFVLRDRGEFFMLPETGANNTVELYRATRFPYEWKLEKVLRSDVRVVDTTPLLLNGIWYFLTTSARHGQETFLFWSTSLDGEWNYHPCNPICSDVRRARGAGPLFHSRGELIRPAQDCSVRYGYAIALNRILNMTPTEYAEELIEVIYPKWRKGLLGTHTLSSNDAFEAIDGLRY